MIGLNQRENGIVDPERVLPVDGEYDVIVTGGGIAGTAAGLAASRRGCKTLIVERESSLGGLATVGLVNIPLDFVGGLGAEMFVRLKDLNALWKRHSDPEKHKLLLDRMVRESGCDVVFHTQVVDSIVAGGEIRGVVVESKSGRQAILGRRVIDASGDGDAATFAGCDVMTGRPSDGMNMAASLEFRLGGVDWDTYMDSDLMKTDPRWEKLIQESLADGRLPYEIDNHKNWLTHVPGRPEHCGRDEVSVCFAHSRNCRPLDNRDLTRMYFEGREQADILWKWIRDNVPGYKHCWLIDTAPLLGVRETRRVVGEYVLTGMDIAKSAHFDDVIAISGHGYDIHGCDHPGNIKWIEGEINGEKRYVICNMAGFGSSAFPPGGPDVLCDAEGRTGDDIQFPSPMYYDIPYRSLLPAGIDNLLVAGRCLSADFPAQSGCRLIMACCNMGEAAGTAAALSLDKNVQPRALDRTILQKSLLENNGNIGQTYRLIPDVTREIQSGLDPVRVYTQTAGAYGNKAFRKYT